MAKVTVGSARIDENGKAYGGKAGDQTGKEVSRQDWYLHKKGWRVLRAKSAEHAEKIAVAMEHACDNPQVGYDQYERGTLRTNVAPFDYDPAKTTKPVETDCSELVRTCIAFAAKRDVIADVLGINRFSTANQAKYMLQTGLFVELTGDSYTKSDKKLCRGDVLVTCSQGHTVVVLSNGSNASFEAIVNDGSKPLLKKGCAGSYVVELQELLMQWKKDCLPKYGADGDFGDETDKALRAFQAEKKLIVDGECGKNTWAELGKLAVKSVVITGATVNVRGEAGTKAKIVCTAHAGDKYAYNETCVIDGTTWYHVERGWVSGKYAQVV